MESPSALVQDIRDTWSASGVEVESTAGNKVRLRMPPYFQGVQEFCESLQPYQVAIDLETSTNGGAISTIFTVYAGADEAYDETPRQTNSFVTSDPFVRFVLVVGVLLQVLSMVNWELVTAKVHNWTQT